MTVTVPVQAKRPCLLHGEYHVIQVPEGSDVQAWRSGELIQNVMPLISREDRETLISGLCPAAWDALIASSDEEEDPDDSSEGEGTV